MSDGATGLVAETATRPLLDAVAALVAEMQPSGAGQQTAVNIHLDSRLDRDLGLDSLGKTELLLRLERLFHVALPEDAFEAATVRELLDQLLACEARIPLQSPQVDYRQQTDQTAAAITLPDTAGTLNEVLAWFARHHGERTAIYLYEDGDKPLTLTYAQWLQSARSIAAGLRHRGLQAGDSVAIMLPTGFAYFNSFFGILLAGGVPVPIYPPTRPNQIEEHLLRHGRILANAGTTMMVTVPQAKTIARLLRAQVPTLTDIVTAEEISMPALYSEHQVHPEDLAFLQYTSGSTGDPKGVQLSHANLLANVRAMGKRVKANPDDVFVSWLPLYHDMGLIGACFGGLYHGMPLAVMSPLRFLRRPASWLWAIHQHGGTLSAAPNFAYELCLRSINDEDIEGLDLSSWRLAFNGAEPVNPDTLRRFASRFAPYGLQPDALAPVYGLAECSVGLAIPEPGRGLKTDRIKRPSFMQQGLAVSAAANDQETLEMVACGHALAGHQIRIVDDKGRELPERREGRLQFKGPSATAGYLHNEQANHDLFDGDWLASGDRAYIADGDVFISGRSKDMIIRAGRNIYPYELEQAVGTVDGIRKGCVAVFASSSTQNRGEQLVVVAETRLTDKSEQHRLHERIRELCDELLDLPPDDVVLVPPHAVLKTSSGKIRRNAIRALYEQDALGQAARAPWWQIMRVAANSIIPELRRFARYCGEHLYSLYAWLVYAVHALLMAPVLLLLPGRMRRWQFLGYCSRSAMFLTGIRLRVESADETGADRASNQPCIVLANHASYVDSLILPGALNKPLIGTPAQSNSLAKQCFRFVAKRELAKVPLLATLLRRMGVLFVERFDLQRSKQDAARVAQAVQDGESLIFFPEGTFTRMPGLLPFRMGAFTAASAAGVPVVPVIMRGTRSMLRADSWFLRRTDINISISHPIAPGGTDWQAASTLRNQARQVMLKLSAEPDLSHEDTPF